MIKISNFNFNDKGEIINIKSKLIDKAISFNGTNFNNLKDLLKYLCLNIKNADINNKSINVELKNRKNNSKEKYEILKIKKENEKNIKILTINEALLDYQPFVEIQNEEILINNSLTHNTKIFLSSCMIVKK